jgi:hypothetical protein
MSNTNQLTASTELVNEIFEATGFSYDIEETENADGTTTLTFDSPKDARKFAVMASTAPDQWQTLEWAA